MQINALLTELKRLDDEVVLTEIHLSKSKVSPSIAIPVFSLCALTSARTAVSSLNENCIVSSSDDEMIQVWDAQTDMALGYGKCTCIILQALQIFLVQSYSLWSAHHIKLIKHTSNHCTGSRIVVRSCRTSAMVSSSFGICAYVCSVSLNIEGKGWVEWLDQMVCVFVLCSLLTCALNGFSSWCTHQSPTSISGEYMRSYSCRDLILLDIYACLWSFWRYEKLRLVWFAGTSAQHINGLLHPLTTAPPQVHHQPQQPPTRPPARLLSSFSKVPAPLCDSPCDSPRSPTASLSSARYTSSASSLFLTLHLHTSCVKLSMATNTPVVHTDTLASPEFVFYSNSVHFHASSYIVL